MRHVWILAGIGLVAGLAGVVAYYTIGGAELGPAWYAISIPVEAIPCVWLGGRLAAEANGAARRSHERDESRT
jgi:peptidoglycan/LPS O-acetylase OafA/YrhL